MLITLSPLKDEAGRPTGIVSFATEITAQKQAEAELRQLASELEARVEERTAEIEQANKRLSHELAVARELSNAADREHEVVLLGESISVRSLRESIQARLDNNIAERALKKAILHRKNSYFYKTLNGAHVGDLFMSLIYICQLCQVNAFDYPIVLCVTAARRRVSNAHAVANCRNP